MRPYLRAANVGWGGLKLEDVKSMHFDDAEMNIYRLRRGDILLAEASGSPAEVGKPAIWNNEIPDCAFQNTLIRVRAHGIDPRYLLHYLFHQARSGAFARDSRGVGIFHLGSATVSRWPIPLVDSRWQQTIADTLDAAGKVVDLYENAESLLGELASAIFNEMFGDPTINDRGWRRASLHEAIIAIDSGRSPVCASTPASPGEWGVLKLGAVTYGEFDANANKAFQGDVTAMESNEVRAGDLLMSRKNTPELVGALALVHETRPRLLLPDLIFRLNVDNEKVDKSYLQALLMHPRKRVQVRGLAGGSAGSMPNISKARLLQLPVELPPLDLQAQFARRIAEVRRRRQRAAVATGTARELYASLQHQAFSGRW